MNFKDAFQIFLDGFGATTEHDCEENKNRMKAPWTLQDGWLILQKRIDNGIIYALFAQHVIADKDVVNMTMQVILKTGIFALEYGEWHTKPKAQRTWGTLKAFMKEKCKLKKNMSNAAGQFGFGMSDATDGDYDKKKRWMRLTLNPWPTSALATQILLPQSADCKILLHSNNNN